MQVTELNVNQFLDISDQATFRVLDLWYENNPELVDDSYKLLPYVQFWKRGAGEGFTPHFDFARNPNDGSFVDCHATVLGYLADPNDYEGGEIFFDDYDIYLKPKQGSMVVFGHQVAHGVVPVTSGTRVISSQHLIKNKDYYKFMNINPDEMTKEQKIQLRKTSPQYEIKNGNARMSARKYEG